MEIRGGDEATITLDGDYSSLAIAFGAQSPDFWGFVVRARFAHGGPLVSVGEFMVSQRPAAREPSRLVATCHCPGAVGWVVANSFVSTPGARGFLWLGGSNASTTPGLAVVEANHQNTTTDTFAGRPQSRNDPHMSSQAIVNDTAFTFASRAIYCGVGGDIVCDLIGDSNRRLFKNVPSGATLPIRAMLVVSAGTTATNLVALY